MALESIFAQLQNMGIMILLIFTLVFTIVFAILNKISLFGKPAESKKFNVVIALVMGALFVFPHVLWGTEDPYDGVLTNGAPDVVDIVSRALPSVSVVLVAILMALLIIGLLGKRFELGGTSLSGWIALGAFALIVFIFGASANWWTAPAFLDFIVSNPDLVALVIVILVFAIIVWFITKEDSPKNDPNSIANQMDKMLQKP